MAIKTPIGKPPLHFFRYLVLTAALMTFLLIVMGGIVRVTESGLGCPDWPLCYGRIIPPLKMESIIEYLHRLIAALTSPLILAAAIVGWLRYRSIRLVSRPLAIAVGFLVVEIVLGAVTVKYELPPAIVAVHLGVALTILAMVLTAAIAALNRYHNPASPDRLAFQSPFGRLACWTLAATFVVLVSGAFVAATEATWACPTWPLCNGVLFPDTPLAWVHMAHRFIVAAASVLVILLFIRAWRTQRSQTAILPAASVAAALFFAQAYVGALKTTEGFPVFLLALHVATAAAVWAAMVSTVVLTGLANRSAEAEQMEARVVIPFGQRVRDLFSMTRPIVTLLLLVTAYGGIVMGAHAWPPFSLVLWTLLGGGLAAGGAQAVNQYMDRDIDQLMLRTAKRPIPAGRMTPGEGLAWGLLLCTVSIYILAGLVNWLAALFSLIGILYYVVIYTLALKRTSVQNIVIGGGAGAMAPVVGWIAATGRLGLPIVFLFAIIFLWTPPHFWALALVRYQDYKNAGVPMMPVVRGEQYTRVQILLYSIGLVIVSLLPTLFRVTGGVYLGLAAVFGAMLLYGSWKLWRQGGNKNAWQLYRISSMYLGFLFVAVIIDALVQEVIINLFAVKWREYGSIL